MLKKIKLLSEDEVFLPTTAMGSWSLICMDCIFWCLLRKVWSFWNLPGKLNMVMGALFSRLSMFMRTNWKRIPSKFSVILLCSFSIKFWLCFSSWTCVKKVRTLIRKTSEIGIDYEFGELTQFELVFAAIGFIGFTVSNYTLNSLNFILSKFCIFISDFASGAIGNQVW